jgi:phage-related protein
MGIRHYRTPAGRYPVGEFLDALDQKARKEVFDALELLGSGYRLSMPLSRPLFGIASGLHELRFRDKQGQIRVVYLIKKGDGVYLLHAFRKKTREMPRKEIELVLKRLKEV